MILSHSHQFIVFKTRKTGGTSFEIALSKYMGAGDVITPIAPDDEKIRAALGYRQAQNHLLDPAGKRKFFNHVGAAEARELMPQDVFARYVKAAIVRNPFDYVVSWYFWERSRLVQTSRADFRQWLAFQFAKRADLETAYREKRATNPGVFASNRFITHVDGRNAMDVMLRYERLQEDAAAFALKVGLPESLGRDLGEIRAKGSYRPAAATAQTMFEDFAEGQDLVRTGFAEEIATYGYDLG